MIEKKVGNVTLRLEDKYIAVFIGSMPVRNVWSTDPIPDFGTEVVAAIEDLRKPLAENECWGPEEKRLIFELRDKDGVGIAKAGASFSLFEDVKDEDKFKPYRDALRIWAEKERARWTLLRGYDDVHVELDGKSCEYGWVDRRGWNDNSNSNLVPTFMRTKAQSEYEAMVREKRPSLSKDETKHGGTGEICKMVGVDGKYIVVEYNGMRQSWCTDSPERIAFRDAYLAKLKPKKPSERLGEALKNVGNPGEASMNELYRILDELAEKVGGL